MVVKSRIDDTCMIRIVIFRGGSHGVRKKSGSTNRAGRSIKKGY
jgi:hypothetical protein